MSKDDLKGNENIDKNSGNEEASQDQELSTDELDAVSGGYFWLGEDAPDGHELNCLVGYYSGWDDFEQSYPGKYCKGSHGQEHEFGDPYIIEEGFGIFRVWSKFKECKKCGYLLFLEGSD